MKFTIPGDFFYIPILIEVFSWVYTFKLGSLSAVSVFMSFIHVLYMIAFVANTRNESVDTRYDTLQGC